MSLDDWTVEEEFDLGAYGREIYDLVPVNGTGLWPSTNQHDTAVPRQNTLAESIKNLVPSGATFIFINGSWNPPSTLDDRHALPFLERDGQYWGLPATDAVAISELERLRKEGTSYDVFAWPAFWWLDYYDEFHHYLRSRFACLCENDQLVAFDLGLPTRH